LLSCLSAYKNSDPTFEFRAASYEKMFLVSKLEAHNSQLPRDSDSDILPGASSFELRATRKFLVSKLEAHNSQLPRYSDSDILPGASSFELRATRKFLVS
jgi:hypothetical protein